MSKSPDAFRTISEVADWLGVQAHVLRFWESKFAQVKPIKRAGGRRYYRPTDMLLLGGIKKLLHDDGLTIKGAQKLLRENGVAFVSDMSQPLDDLTMAVIEGNIDDAKQETPQVAQPDAGTPVSKGDAVEQVSAVEETTEVEDTAPDLPAPDTPEEVLTTSDLHAPLPAGQEELSEDLHAESDEPGEAPRDDTAERQPDLLEAAEPPSEAPATTPAPLEVQEDTPATEDPPEIEEADAMPSFRARPRTPDPEHEVPADAAPVAENETPAEARPETPVAEEAPLLSPQEHAAPQQEDTGAAAAAPDGQNPVDEPALAVEMPDPAPQEPPKPNVVDIPPVPDATEISVNPSALSALAKIKRLTPEQAHEIKPLLARLTRLRASMASPRKEIRKD
ncbi:MerR family transcriptional regulator [Roseobacter weihaiensis]|uniref:MerR family transcriptional regulator n=1 Tax=Roseobacter weihaiensis TaxID=2763262 RepID=UPI001D0A82D1|nr:MerR family transcriptional regulator [Roseobacter sp. H9]